MSSALFCSCLATKTVHKILSNTRGVAINGLLGNIQTISFPGWSNLCHLFSWLAYHLSTMENFIQSAYPLLLVLSALCSQVVDTILCTHIKDMLVTLECLSVSNLSALV